MNEELKKTIGLAALFTAVVAAFHVLSIWKEPEQVPVADSPPRVMSLSDKCAMHSKVAEVPTKYVDGVGCYEKKFHRWELVQFPED